MQSKKPILFSLIFFSIFELAVFSENFFWWFFSLSFVFSLVFSWYFLKKASLVTKVAVLPPIGFSLFYLIQNFQIKQIIIIFLSFCFYFLFKPNIKKSYLILISFSELLLIFSLLFAYSSFYNLSLWMALLIIFISSFSIFFSSIAGVLNLQLTLKIRLFYFSAIVAIVISELYWLMIKFPFDFFTSGFILFLIYYAIWDISIRYFANNLTKKSIYLTLTLLFIILILVFFILRFLF
jgi:hypothetical protein